MIGYNHGNLPVSVHLLGVQDTGGMSRLNMICPTGSVAHLIFIFISNVTEECTLKYYLSYLHLVW